MTEARKRAYELLGRMIAEVQNTPAREAPDYIGAWLRACAEPAHTGEDSGGISCGLVDPIRH